MRDDEHINILVQKKVNYWTKKLNVPSITLVNAVTSVGSNVKDVRKWLDENRFKYDLNVINLITGIVNTQFFFHVQDSQTF